MDCTIFSNVLIFDGSGSDPFPGEVQIRGNRIAEVARDRALARPDDARIIDGRGATLMPGLVEAHAHLGFAGTIDRRVKWRELTKEQHLLATASAGKTMLDYGFTSAYSGGSSDAKFEVALKEEYARGALPGPRLRACSFERNASANRGIANAYGGISQREPDVEGICQFVRDMIEIGVDSIKFVLTGESAIRPGTSRIPQFYEEEISAATQIARDAGVWLNAHCHSAESIKLALKNGFRALYHCTWADEEAIDMLEAHKDTIFVAPAPGVNYAAIHEAADYGISYEMAVEQEQVETLKQVSRIMPELHQRGVRVLPGGDYGFPWNPIGKNARDLSLFVQYFHFTPAEALRAATCFGGQIMGQAHELGLIRAGYLADILLIDGDPLADIDRLQNQAQFLAIMKDGQFHKLALAPVNGRQVLARAVHEQPVST